VFVEPRDAGQLEKLRRMRAGQKRRLKAVNIQDQDKESEREKIPPPKEAWGFEKGGLAFLLKGYKVRCQS